MRTPGYALPGKALITFAAALLALAPLHAGAQSQRDHYYRAEIVIVERIVDPEDVQERMASRVPETAEEISEQLRVEQEDGSVETTLDLAPVSDLHLRSAAQRLEGSGRFRVLMSAGWYQSFPPDYDGEPMRVAVGDWLDEAGHPEVEGQITIDRQRYLHVGVELNHWQPSGASMTPVQKGTGSTISPPGADSAEALDAPATDSATDSVGELAQGGDISTGVAPDSATTGTPGATLTAKAELLTWIRETRRMRSEEVHFLDSPTIGVLVFFKRVED